MPTQMVVNTLRNLNLALALRPTAHYIILRGVVNAKCTNGVCIVVGLIVALERTLVKLEYEEKKKSPVHCPGQNAAVLCKNYHCSFNYRSASPAEERKRSRKKKI